MPVMRLLKSLGLSSKEQPSNQDRPSHHAQGRQLASHTHHTMPKDNYSKMLSIGRKWSDIQIFLEKENWVAHTGGPRVKQLEDHYPRWKTARELYNTEQARSTSKDEVTLTQIMKQPWQATANYHKNMTKSAYSEDLTKSQGETIVDQEIKADKTSGYLIHNRQDLYPFGLYFDVLGTGIHGRGHLVRMLITPHPFTEKNKDGSYLVILMDTRLLVYVVFRHVPSPIPPDDTMYIHFFANLADFQRRHLRDDVWVLDEATKFSRNQSKLRGFANRIQYGPEK